jgi:hypothetical protein
MISSEQKKYILTRAYVPEHSVDLMTSISGGEPFLIEDYFCCLKEDWLIVIGYPLQQNFVVQAFENFIDKISRKFAPRYLSLIAPELPSTIAGSCRERESDHYYTLDVPSGKIKSHLRRAVEKAEHFLTVQRSSEIERTHEELMVEFTERVKPNPRVRDLLFRMPHFVGHAKDCLILNAWDERNNLAAFYVVDLGPEHFSTYVIGCYSKKNCVPGASDLLQFKTIEISKEYGKEYIHLGLGVSKGIRQFKKKWGGVATRTYEMCELVRKEGSVLEKIMAAREMLKAR